MSVRFYYPALVVDFEHPIHYFVSENLSTRSQDWKLDALNHFCLFQACLWFAVGLKVFLLG